MVTHILRNPISALGPSLLALMLLISVPHHIRVWDRRATNVGWLLVLADLDVLVDLAGVALDGHLEYVVGGLGPTRRLAMCSATTAARQGKIAEKRGDEGHNTYGSGV